MTLLLATLSADSVVITADGLSISEDLRAIGRTTLPKVFVLSQPNVAIAQAGRNFIQLEDRGKISFAKAISEWSDSAWPLTVQETALQLESRIRSADASYFERWQPTIWIAGFSAGNDTPQLWEVTEEGCTVVLRAQEASGAAADFLEGRAWSDHDEAWSLAVNEQHKRGLQLPCFGGHRQRLRITKSGPDWVELSPKGFLGVGELLPAIDKIGDEIKCQEPKRSILDTRTGFQSALCERARIKGKRHPRTYFGAKENWVSERCSDEFWALADCLIAISDEASLADPSDVSEGDAALYGAHVNQILRCLPSAE